MVYETAVAILFVAAWSSILIGWTIASLWNHA